MFLSISLIVQSSCFASPRLATPTIRFTRAYRCFTSKLPISTVNVFYNTGTMVQCVSEEESYKAHDFMGRTDKEKLIKLALELLKDAKLKLRQVTGLRDEHSAMTSFEVGVVIGKIREKYKRMLETYREALDRFNNRTRLQGPSVREFRPVHYIIAMELIHTKEVDIDKLVHILESIPPKMLDKSSDSFFKRPNTTNSTTTSSSKPPRFRAGYTGVDEESTQRTEHELKRQYREEYLKRQIGPEMDPNTVLRGPNSILDIH